MSSISYLVLELGTVIVFGLMIWHASRLGRGAVLELLTAAVYGILLEWGDILLFGTYTYSPHFIIAIGPVPIIIGLCWAMIIYGAMHYSDMLGLPVWLAPFADAIWAIVLDLAFDAVAIRLEFWTWNIPLESGFFGVPAGNFHAWLYVALGFSAMTRLARARPAQRRGLQLLTPVSAYVILIAAILFFDLLVLVFYPPHAQGDKGMPIFVATLTIFAAVSGYALLCTRRRRVVRHTSADIIPLLARWSMHLYFGAWLVLWLLWPELRLPGKDLPPMLLVVAAVMLGVEILLLVPSFTHRMRVPLPEREGVLKGAHDHHAA
jgi:hypothetical protein